MVVVCSLNSQVKSHIRELDTRGITATSLTGEDVDEDKLLCGHYLFIFANPESLILNESGGKCYRVKLI